MAAAVARAASQPELGPRAQLLIRSVTWLCRAWLVISGGHTMLNSSNPRYTIKPLFMPCMVNTKAWYHAYMHTHTVYTARKQAKTAIFIDRDISSVEPSGAVLNFLKIAIAFKFF